MNAVLPYTVWTVSEPLLMLYVSFGQVKFHTHEVNNTIEVICVNKACPAVWCDVPFCFLQRTKLVGRCNNKSITFTFCCCYLVKLTLFCIFSICCLLLFCLTVVMVVELIHRAVGALVGKEPRAIIEFVVAFGCNDTA